MGHILEQKDPEFYFFMIENANAILSRIDCLFASFDEYPNVSCQVHFLAR